MLLYAVTDRTWLNGRSLLQDIEESLKGGITCLQLREKNMPFELFLKEAKDVSELCRQYHVPFIINDNIEVAVSSNADGIHVGQHDMPPGEVRKKIGADKILGVSAQTVEQAIQAEKDGADYLGVGAVFPTSTKDDADAVSLETLKAICNAVHIPVVAIGGINEVNLTKLSGTGIDGIAVVSAIYAQNDIKNAAQKLKEYVQTVCRIH